MDNNFTILILADILIENASYDRPAGTDRIAELLVQRGNASEAEAEVLVNRVISEYLDKPLILGITLRKRDEGYYIDLPLSETDIVVLRSMLISMPYCERWHLSQIYKCLESFLPAYMREEDSTIYTYSEKYSGTFYENMSVIIKALFPAEGGIRKLSFEYCEYDMSLDLIPKKSRSDGSLRRIVDPVKIVFVNGFFYLVAFFVKDEEIRFINYRIDRIKNAECTDVPAESFEKHISNKRQYALELKRRIEHERSSAKLRNIIYHEPNDDTAALDDTRRIDKNGFNLSDYIFRSKLMYTDKMLDRVRVKIDKNSLNGTIDLVWFQY